MDLVLSIFPGIDLLGRGFELEGFSVVRGPDLLWGADVRGFHLPAERFDGIIAGSPCPDFSRARRSAPSGEGVEMLREFCRIVSEGQPRWFLLENVPGVPDVRIEGYSVQRFDLDARECGMRHRAESQPTCMATEGLRKNRRTWADFCELQGLSRDFDLPGWPREFRYRAVGNGVPIPVARAIALAIRDSATAAGAKSVTDRKLCICGCTRVLKGKQRAATDACRKRLERARREPRPVVGL